MSGQDATTSRMYIHRRFVVRFLVALLALLSVASFASIALGWGANSSNAPSEDSGTPTKLADMRPFYALLVGSDSLAGTALYTGGVGSGSQADHPQADGLVLMRVDPGACTVTLVTVPSNTVLEDSSQMLRDTLTAEGPSETVRAVEQLAGVSIRYWFLMDFSGFEALMAQVGGVQANVPVPITMQDPITAKPVSVAAGKKVLLDEAQTLVYLRSTDPYLVDADPHRQLNVRNVISGSIAKVLSLDDDAVRKVLGVFEDEVETNIDNGTLISLVTRFYDEKEATQVFSCTGPYLASSITENGEPVVEQQVAAWRELMNAVDSGEDPAAVLPQYDFKGSKSDYVKVEVPASSSSTASASPSAASGKAPAGAGSIGKGSTAEGPANAKGKDSAASAESKKGGN